MNAKRVALEAINSYAKRSGENLDEGYECESGAVTGYDGR